MLQRDQLLKLGFDEEELRLWRNRGTLVPLLPEIYRLSLYPKTWEQDLLAATWWGRKGSAVCGETAAALHGLSGYERQGPIHLSVPGRPRPPRRGEVQLVLHCGRTLCRWDLQKRGGLVFTTVERTLLDLAPSLTLEQLDALMDECLRKGLTHAKGIRACYRRLKAKGRKGAEQYGRLLAMRGDTLLRTDSPMETDFLKLFADMKLEMPTTRHWVSCGDIHYRLDLAYVHLKVGIEIDSRAHHDGWQKRLHDMARQNDLVSWGWRILRFSHADLQRPLEVARLIRSTLALALAARRSAA